MMNARRALSDSLAIALIACNILGAASVRAAVLEVDVGGPSPYHVIQDAIEDAVPGVDSVFVHCGIYYELVDMRNGVSVQGAGAPCTVIDGGGDGSVVFMIGISSPGTTLQGFTIRNGKGPFGGGIYIENGSPTVTRNVITGNRAERVGGVGGYGGGIHVTSPNNADLTAFTTAPTITRNIIVGNRADKFGGGIEIYADDGTVVSNNIIKDNSAADTGGGIDTYQSFPTIVNNTIVRNCIQGTITSCALGGGGIALTNSGTVPIRNNLIAWNEAAAGGGGVDAATSTATFNANDAWQNLPANYAGITNPTGSNGNISADPLLVDEIARVEGLQPRSNSPLVESGNNSFAPSVDLRGIARPEDSDANGTARADIGARENEGITRLGFSSKTAISWDASGSGSPSYNLYRGDLATLKSTGVYNQNTGTVPGARRQCNLGSPSATDTDVPTTGQAFFYLAVVKRAIEGTLGFTSVPTKRLYSAGNRCP